MQYVGGSGAQAAATAGIVRSLFDSSASGSWGAQGAPGFALGSLDSALRGEVPGDSPDSPHRIEWKMIPRESVAAVTLINDLPEISASVGRIGEIVLADPLISKLYDPTDIMREEALFEHPASPATKIVPVAIKPPPPEPGDDPLKPGDDDWPMVPSPVKPSAHDAKVPLGTDSTSVVMVPLRRSQRFIITKYFVPFLRHTITWSLMVGVMPYYLVPLRDAINNGRVRSSSEFTRALEAQDGGDILSQLVPMVPSITEGDIYTGKAGIFGSQRFRWVWRRSQQGGGGAVLGAAGESSGGGHNGHDQTADDRRILWATMRSEEMPDPETGRLRSRFAKLIPQLHALISMMMNYQKGLSASTLPPFAMAYQPAKGGVNAASPESSAYGEYKEAIDESSDVARKQDMRDFGERLAKAKEWANITDADLQWSAQARAAAADPMYAMYTRQLVFDRHVMDEWKKKALFLGRDWGIVSLPQAGGVTWVELQGAQEAIARTGSDLVGYPIDIVRSQHVTHSATSTNQMQILNQTTKSLKTELENVLTEVFVCANFRAFAKTLLGARRATELRLHGGVVPNASDLQAVKIWASDHINVSLSTTPFVDIEQLIALRALNTGLVDDEQFNAIVRGSLHLSDNPIDTAAIVDKVSRKHLMHGGAVNQLLKEAMAKEKEREKGKKAAKKVKKIEKKAVKKRVKKAIKKGKEKTKGKEEKETSDKPPLKKQKQKPPKKPKGHLPKELKEKKFPQVPIQKEPEPKISSEGSQARMEAIRNFAEMLAFKIS